MAAGASSPVDVSRGMFAGEVGTPRLLDLFAHFAIKSTWFIPGHSMETFPDQVGRVIAAGHEVGLHDYAHENVRRLNAEQEEAVLRRAIELVERAAARRPKATRPRVGRSAARPSLCSSNTGSATTTA